MKTHVKFLFFSTLIVLATALTIYQCEKPKSGENALTKLVVTADKDYTATIAGTNVTFAESFPYNTTQVTIKTLEVSPNASDDRGVGGVLQSGGGRHRRDCRKWRYENIQSGFYLKSIGWIYSRHWNRPSEYRH